MHYSIRHVTKFRYSEPITESIMEVHIQPRSDNFQRCLNFQLQTNPRAQIFSYPDDLGNMIHHFDIPNKHKQLVVIAEAKVEIISIPEIPLSLPVEAWAELDALTAKDEHWDMLQPSHFARPSSLLKALVQELNIERRDDPLSLLREINTAIYNTFEYDTKDTRVDSPIDDALTLRRGVCQDFTHIMITIVRGLGIPCRYVSGYLFHRSDSNDHSARGATHAWVEALLPGLNWVGFDPTNNLIAGDRHIRVAVGRDYYDVPPTRGVFKGTTDSELGVSVEVTQTDREVVTSRRSTNTEFAMAMQASERQAQQNFNEQQQQ